MTPVEFNRRKVNKTKLLSFGFEAIDGGYVYQTDLSDGQMKLTVLLNSDDVLYAEARPKCFAELLDNIKNICRRRTTVYEV